MERSRALGQPGHGTTGVREIPENTSFCRACLTACRKPYHIFISELSSILPSLMLGLLQTVNAEKAFLHDTLRSNGNVWVVLLFHRLWPLRLIPVEGPS
jgi:hypothetical protein